MIKLILLIVLLLLSTMYCRSESRSDTLIPISLNDSETFYALSKERLSRIANYIDSIERRSKYLSILTFTIDSAYAECKQILSSKDELLIIANKQNDNFKSIISNKDSIIAYNNAIISKHDARYYELNKKFLRQKKHKKLFTIIGLGLLGVSVGALFVISFK